MGSDDLKVIDFRHGQSSARLREFQVIVVIAKRRQGRNSKRPATLSLGFTQRCFASRPQTHSTVLSLPRYSQYCTQPSGTPTCSRPPNPVAFTIYGHTLLLLLLLLLLQLSCHPVAVVTLAQTKQIRINYTQTKQIQKRSTNNTKHSKYKYTYYQKQPHILPKQPTHYNIPMNTSTHFKIRTYTHPRVTKHTQPHITKQVKTTTEQDTRQKPQYNQAASV